MPKLSKDYISKLKESIYDSRRVYATFAENRLDHIRQLAGNHYAENGAKNEVPMNLLSLWCSTVVRTLIPRSPKGLFTSFDLSIKPMLQTIEHAVNRKMEKIHIDDTLRMGALDALILMGIAHCSLVSPADAEMYGYERIAGQACVDIVDYDDFVIDHRAKNLRMAGFYGHRYQVLLDSVKDSKLYDAARKKLSADEYDAYNEDGTERVSSISRSNSFHGDEFADYVELWRIYLPREKLLVTLHEDLEEPLKVEEWVGPGCGPYHLLWYGELPGNAMPKSPIMDLISMHKMYNELTRKLCLQALSQKTLLGVTGGDDQDAERIQATPDQHTVRIDQPEKVKEISLGGPNQLNMNFIPWLFSSFDKHGGNMSMIGGLGTQSPTATQDQMLEKNASKFIQDMQARTMTWVQSIYKAMAWFMYNHPTEKMKAPITIGGRVVASEEAPADQRHQTAFEDLDIEINPYSMGEETPQSKMMILDDIMKNVLVPLSPILEKQGISTDIGAYLKTKAKYHNLPELLEVVSLNGPIGMQQPQEQEGEGADTLQPAETTRNYNRTSSPGKMSQQALGDMMMRGNQGTSPQEDAAMSRSI